MTKMMKPSGLEIRNALLNAYANSGLMGGEETYIAQDENGVIFTTQDGNDPRAAKWLAKVEALDV